MAVGESGIDILGFQFSVDKSLDRADEFEKFLILKQMRKVLVMGLFR